MTKYVDLHKAFGAKLREDVKSAEGAAAMVHTRPTGVMALGDGDVVWRAPELVPDPANPDGPLVEGPNEVQWSIRNVPVITDNLVHELEGAQVRIEVAESELGDAQAQIATVLIDLGDVSDVALGAQSTANAAQSTANTAQTNAAAALASANGRNARIISLSAASGSTNPTTNLPLVTGDTWWRWDNLTNRNVIGSWVWDGTAWRVETLGHQVLGSLDLNKLLVVGTARMNQAVVEKIIGDAAFFNALRVEDLTVTAGATIKAAVIQKLSAEQIASGEFRTNVNPDTGMYAIMDNSGFRLINNNGPDGSAIEVIRIGPDGNTLIQIGSGLNQVAIDSSGNISARRASVQSLMVNGVNYYAAHKDPRGVVAQKQMFPGFGLQLQSRDYVLWFRAYVNGGRVYKLSSSTMTVQTQNANVAPMLNLHYTIDGGNTFPSANWDASRVAESYVGPFGSFRSLPPMEGYIDLRARSGIVEIQGAVSLADIANAGWCQVAAPVQRARMVLEDVGVDFPDLGQAYYSAGPVVTPVRQVKRWTPSDWGTYFRGGTRDTAATKPIQGQYSSYNRCAFFVFPDMTADLSGAAIHRVTLHSFADHWSYGSGGTGSWCWHGHYGPLPNNVLAHTWLADTPNWARGAANEIDLAPAEFARWQNGTARGFGFATPNTSLTYYGNFSPNLGATWVEVEYSK